MRRPIVLTGFLALAVFLVVTACTGSRHNSAPMGGMLMSPTARASAYATALRTAAPNPDQPMPAMDAPLSAVLCPQTPSVTDATLPAPVSVMVTQDDLVARVTWDNYTAWDQLTYNARIGGYLVTWGVSGGTLVCALESYSQFDAQPMVAATNYVVTIQVIGMDGRTGPVTSTFSRRNYNADGSPGTATAGQTTFASDTTREAALASTMTGFFYNDNNGNTPEYIDPDKWNVAFSACDNPNTSGSFTNGQSHFHTMAGSNIDGYPAGSLGYCDRAQTTMRSHTNPDLTTGLTAAHTASGTETLSNLTEPHPYRTFVFDVDGNTGGRDKTYWDLIERPDGQPTDLTGDVNVGSAFDSNTPNDLRVELFANNSNIYYAGADGYMQGLAGNQRGNCDLSCTAAGGIQMGPNVRHNVIIHLGQDASTGHIDVWIDGEKTVSWDALTTNFAHPSMVLDTFAYNSPKDGTTNAFNHWDNAGFDGPAPTTVTYNYTDGAISSEKFTGVKGSYTDTIKMPDSLATATKIRLLFNQQMPTNQTYFYCSTDKVSINGHDFALPTPFGPAGLTVAALVSVYAPYQSFVDNIPSADIVTGNNTVVFTLCNSGVINAHIEVTYPSGSAPTLTPWWTSWGLGATVVMPTPTQGVWTQFTTLGTVGAFTVPPTGSQNQPLAMSGTVPLSWQTNAVVQLKTSGKVTGARTVQITVDGSVVATVLAAVTEPVPWAKGTYNLDTTLLPNGQHQLDLISADDAGVPGAPGYFEQFGFTGHDESYKIDVENAGSTVTPSPTPGPGTPTATPTPSPTPIVTPSPSPSPSPTASPTIVPTLPPTPTATPQPTASPTPQPTPNPADPCNTAGTAQLVASLTQSTINAQGIERGLALAEIWAGCESAHGTLPPQP